MKLIEITEAGGPEVLKVSQGKMPECGENDVLISVKAAGVNRPDIMQREGKYPMPEGVTPVPGLEVAGIVHSIGKNVAQLAIASVRSPMAGDMQNFAPFRQVRYCLSHKI